MRIIIVLLALLISGNAYAQIKKPSDVIRDLRDGGGQQNLTILRPAVSESFPGIENDDDLIDKFNKLALPDFTYAQAMAHAAANPVTEPCWAAWVDLIGKQQMELKDATGAVLAMPDPHLIVDIERVSELIQSLQQGGKIQVGCGAFVNALGLTMRQFIGKVLTGGAIGALKVIGVP